LLIVRRAFDGRSNDLRSIAPRTTNDSVIAHGVVTRRFVGAAGAAPCDTVTVRPAMVTVVLRAEEVADAENAIVAGPVPEAGAVIVNHVAPLVAVHGQPAVAVRVTEPAPPPAARLTVVGDTANEQAF